MKYSIHIDQVASIEWGLNLPEAAIFSFLYSVSGWADPVVIGGEVWYFASRHKAIAEMPIVSDVPDTIYRQYKSLAEKGVIEWQKHLGMDCVRITAKGAAWNSEKNPRNSENFPKTSAELGKKSEKTRKKIRENSEKNPTYKYTIDKGTIDKREGGNLSLSNKKTETETPTSQPLPHPPCPAAPPSPDQDWVSCQAHLVASLEGEYASLLEGARQRTRFRGPIGPVAGDYCRNIEEGLITGKGLFHLRPPDNPGEHRKWVSRMLSGIERYMAAAVRRENNNRNERKRVAPDSAERAKEQSGTGNRLGIKVY